MALNTITQIGVK